MGPFCLRVHENFSSMAAQAVKGWVSLFTSLSLGCFICKTGGTFLPCVVMPHGCGQGSPGCSLGGGWFLFSSEFVLSLSAA